MEGNTGRERERFIKQRKIFIITCRRFNKLKFKREKDKKGI